MKKLHKVALTAVVAMFALSASPLMENNYANVAQAATKRTTHHKKLTKKARYAKIRRRGHVYVTTFAHGFYYKDAALKHRVAKRGYKAGKNLRIKKVVLYHGLQRYQLTNGEYITAYNADFNYHYTFKKFANKMVKHETIIKKAKKHSKKINKKPTNNNNNAVNNKPDNNANAQNANTNKQNNTANTQNNNSRATVLLNGKISQSAFAPTDANVDPFANKHSEGDMWYQQNADGKTIVATFKFTNGKWVIQNNNNSNNNKTNTQSSNNNTQQNPTNNAKTAYTITQNKMNNIYTSTSAPTDVQNISPLPISGDVWKKTDASGNVVNTYTFKDNNWVNNTPAKPAAQQPTTPANSKPSQPTQNGNTKPSTSADQSKAKETTVDKKNRVNQHNSTHNDNEKKVNQYNDAHNARVEKHKQHEATHNARVEKHKQHEATHNAHVAKYNRHHNNNSSKQ